MRNGLSCRLAVFSAVAGHWPRLPARSSAQSPCPMSCHCELQVSVASGLSQGETRSGSATTPAPFPAARLSHRLFGVLRKWSEVVKQLEGFLVPRR